MARNKVEICGVDTSKLPVLKNQEMRVLFQKYQAGDLRSEGKIGQWESALGIECDSAF